METVNKQFVQTMAQHYLMCAAWADGPEETRARWPIAEIQTAEKVCAVFLEYCGAELINAAIAAGFSAERMGHDFWLTRCGHGAGFWDRNELAVEFTPASPYTLKDRDGKPYTLQPGLLIGEALTVAAYGEANCIAPFAYPDLETYKGWHHITGAAEYSMGGAAVWWDFWKEWRAKNPHPFTPAILKD